MDLKPGKQVDAVIKLRENALSNTPKGSKVSESQT